MSALPTNVIPMKQTEIETDPPSTLSPVHLAVLDKALAHLQVLPGVSFHITVGGVDYKYGLPDDSQGRPAITRTRRWAHLTNYLTILRDMEKGEVREWSQEEFEKEYPSKGAWNSFCSSVRNGTVRNYPPETFTFVNKDGHMSVCRITK